MNNAPKRIDVQVQHRWGGGEIPRPRTTLFNWWVWVKKGTGFLGIANEIAVLRSPHPPVKQIPHTSFGERSGVESRHAGWNGTVQHAKRAARVQTAGVAPGLRSPKLVNSGTPAECVTRTKGYVAKGLNVSRNLMRMSGPRLNCGGPSLFHAALPDADRVFEQ